MNETNKYLSQLADGEQKRYRYELSKLDAAQLQQLEALVTRMARSGARRPLSWAWSEFREGIPQWARFMILKGMYLSAGDLKGNTDAATDFLPCSGSTYNQVAAAIGEEKLNQFLVSYSKGMLYNLLGLFDEGHMSYGL